MLIFTTKLCQIQNMILRALIKIKVIFKTEYGGIVDVRIPPNRYASK